MIKALRVEILASVVGRSKTKVAWVGSTVLWVEGGEEVRLDPPGPLKGGRVGLAPAMGGYTPLFRRGAGLKWEEYLEGYLELR